MKKNFSTFSGVVNDKHIKGLKWEDSEGRVLIIHLNKTLNKWRYDGYSDVVGSISGIIPDNIMIESVKDMTPLYLFLKGLFK